METMILHVTRRSAVCGKATLSTMLVLGCPRVVKFTTIFELSIRQRCSRRFFSFSIRGIFLDFPVLVDIEILLKLDYGLFGSILCIYEVHGDMGI